MLPPMVQLPRDGRSSAKQSPSLSAVSCTVASVVPAATIMTDAVASNSSTPVIRSRDKASSPGCGVAPPTRPVKPPCTTTGLAAA